ncbi:hypothetical protein HMPREF0528_1406 [Lactobacillus johnsonii ATCC 33200]|uniref:Uncharacterized protein n=1 Tax=Lactobacillus johnsonii ATCC 33200 TaxID=525330 RepID=C2E6N2_LACJH|nr:hypothetical protein HMPREF0528_1406 [Lactobacillus johnsonii ATCC 33200]KRK56041.1 hypothetical protein FC22_GL000188 [Lactobacillus johnsonii ATCC 33200]
MITRLTFFEVLVVLAYTVLTCVEVVSTVIPAKGAVSKGIVVYFVYFMLGSPP